MTQLELPLAAGKNHTTGLTEFLAVPGPPTIF